MRTTVKRNHNISFRIRMVSNIIIPVPQYIRALLFDCDGTLVDSMPLHMEAWEYVITQAGATFDFDFFSSKKGMKETEIINLYNKEYGTSLVSEKIVAKKKEYVMKHIERVKPIEPVLDVVKRYWKVLPMAVVSGSTRAIVESELNTIGILNCFDVILTADDPIPQKPSPDMFLEAARRMNVPPDCCQVFEDGDYGLLAAQRAGMLPTDIRQFITQE